MRRLRIKVHKVVPRSLEDDLFTPSLAVDRVHRLGQEKTVYVKHFIVSRLRPSSCLSECGSNMF
jgi:hypothetical protein